MVGYLPSNLSTFTYGPPSSGADSEVSSDASRNASLGSAAAVITPATDISDSEPELAAVAGASGCKVWYEDEEEVDGDGMTHQPLVAEADTDSGEEHAHSEDELGDEQVL